MADGRILATVAGEAITEREVEETLLSMGQRAQAYDNERGREAILEQLINRKLILLDAKRNLFEREEEFKAQMARVKEELLSNYAVEKVIKNVRVTDDEIKAFYEEHKSEFVSPERIDTSHILVEDKAECERIKGEIAEGKITFEDAAKKYSVCPSKESGGALGEAGRGQFVPEFENAAFDATEGEITGPVKTQFGYHLIRLNKKIPAGTLELSDIKDSLREKLLQDKQQKAYQSKIAQLKIMYMVDKF